MRGHAMRFIRPHLGGIFVLVACDTPAAEVGHRYDGPFDSADAIFDPDNAVVFVGDGLPYRIGVVDQDGPVLTLHDGSRVRVIPWPLAPGGGAE